MFKPGFLLFGMFLSFSTLHVYMNPLSTTSELSLTTGTNDSSGPHPHDSNHVYVQEPSKDRSPENKSNASYEQRRETRSVSEENKKDDSDICISFEPTSKDMTSIESEILAHILGNYDFRLRPDINKKVLDIDVAIWVYNIGPISETSMNFRTDFYFTQAWFDKRLDFSSKVCNHTNVTFTMNHEYSEIWMPDTYFPNALEAETHSVTTENKAVWLRSDGRVSTSSRVTIVSRCPMEFDYFPLDIQSCDLRFLSYGYKERDVRMRWSEDFEPIKIEDDVTIAQFTLLQNKKTVTSLTYHHGTYSCLIVTFVFQRNVGYYLIQTIIPSVLCVSLSWVSFWIKPDATPARASLGITTVLAVVTLIASDSWSLPRISTIKAIEVYLFSCLLFVFGALIEFSVICYWSKPPKKEPNVDDSENHLIETEMTTKMLPSREDEEVDSPNCTQNNCRKKEREQFAGVDVERIDFYCRFAFPTAFTLFNFIYWLSYLTIARREATRHLAEATMIEAM